LHIDSTEGKGEVEVRKMFGWSDAIGVGYFGDTEEMGGPALYPELLLESVSFNLPCKNRAAIISNYLSPVFASPHLERKIR